MGNLWTGKSGFTKELSVTAKAMFFGDRLSIVTQDEDDPDFEVNAMSFDKSEALSLAKWIIENVREAEE